MRKIAIYIVCFILSVFMYIYAPRDYDFTFILCATLLFVFPSICSLVKDFKQDGLMTFNMFFLVAYFFVSYAYPLFIINSPLQDFFVGIYDYIDYSVSSRCAALCTLGISSYLVAYEQYRGKKVNFQRWVKIVRFNGIKIIYIITFVAVLLKTVLYMRSTNGIAIESGFWGILYEASFCVYLVYNCKKVTCCNFVSFIRINALPLISCLILMLLFLVAGDRGLIITCGLIILGVYWFFVSRIKIWWLLSGLFAGVLLMFIIQQTRTTDSSLSTGDAGGFVSEAASAMSETTSGLMFFSDFLIIHRELYLGYEYYQKYGTSYPLQIFIVPFYPLPFVPSLISQMLFGKIPNDIKPGVILNDYISYTGYGHLGIHAVSDLIMRFGYVGLIGFFFLWGYVVARISASRNTGILGAALFIMILSQAIYVPRAPIVDQVKVLADVVIIVWLSTLISKISLR